MRSFYFFTVAFLMSFVLITNRWTNIETGNLRGNFAPLRVARTGVWEILLLRLLHHVCNQSAANISSQTRFRWCCRAKQEQRREISIMHRQLIPATRNVFSLVCKQLCVRIQIWKQKLKIPGEFISKLSLFQPKKIFFIFVAKKSIFCSTG